MRNRRRSRIVVAAVAVIAIVGLVLTYTVKESEAASNVAKTSNKELYEKAMLNGLKKCYNDQSKSPVDLNADSTFSFNKAINSAGTVVLPYKIKNALNVPKVNCLELIAGKNSGGTYNGILKHFSKENLATQYTPWGYKADGNTDKQCFSFDYDLIGDTKIVGGQTSNNICAKVNSNGFIEYNSFQLKGSVPKKSMHFTLSTNSGSEVYAHKEGGKIVWYYKQTGYDGNAQKAHCTPTSLSDSDNNALSDLSDGQIWRKEKAHWWQSQADGEIIYKTAPAETTIGLKYKDSTGVDRNVPGWTGVVVCHVPVNSMPAGAYVWDNDGATKAAKSDFMKSKLGSAYNTIGESAIANNLKTRAVASMIENGLDGVQDGASVTSKTKVSISSSGTGSDTLATKVKRDGSKTDAAKIALRTLTGKAEDKFTNYKFDDYDAVSLDLKYIQAAIDKFPTLLKLYDDDTNCGTYDDVKDETYIIPTQKTKGNKKIWCKLANVEDASKKFKDASTPEAVFSIVNNETSLKLVPLTDVVKDLKRRHETVEDMKTSSLNHEGKDKKTEDEDGSSEDACQQAAGSLSWIICPVMTTLNNATQGIYNNAIEPILQVNAGALSTTSGSGQSNGVYKAWKDFRNFANIGFAIALALVILSQLTGFGLSNYSIKKILPRLIMVIVLVNISFILCQLAVDLSNVLGSVLRTTLTDLANSINTEVKNSHSNFFGGYVLGGVMDMFLNGGTFALLGAVIGGVALTWDVWLIPLILILITFLLSVLFFFIILAVRQAGIFILIVLAPVAIICYALPNTKSLFDKWYKLFMALLLAYPICGLMMGGGQFASALLFEVGVQTKAGFFMLLIAVIVSVAPFFLIPGVIKNSMGALGNIGMKLSNFGSKAGNFLGGMFVGSRLGDRINRRAKARTDNREETREYNAQGRALRRDRRALNRLQSRGNLSDRQRVRAGRLTNRVLAGEKARNANMLRGQQMVEAGGINKLIRRQNREQEDELEKAEVTNILSQYQHGEISGVNFSQLEANSGNGGLTGTSLEAEYGRQLDILQGDPTNREAQRKVKALQQHFANQGDKGRAVIQRAFESRLTSGQTVGLGEAARAISADSRMLGEIKGADRGLFAMVNDVTSGNAVTGADEVDSHGVVTRLGAASHYGAIGTNKYTAQSLANADEGTLDRLISGVESGNISGAELDNIAATAREALSNDNIQVKPEYEGRLKQLANASYAQGASSSATSGTAGSNAMARSSARDIDNAASYIRRMNNGISFAGTSANASNNADYKMIQDMAQNAQTALKDSTKTYTQDQVKAMQDVIKAARDMGVTNDVGNTFNNVDAASIQVRGIEPRAIPTRPANFDEHGNFRDIANPTRTPTAAEQEAFNQYARERAAAERYNRRHGFNNPGSGNP